MIRTQCTLLLGILLFTGPLAAADAKSRPSGPMHEGPLAVILEHRQELNLTSEQIQKLEAVKKEADEFREKLMNDPQMREMFKQMREGKAKGGAAPTSQQREELREKMKAKFGGQMEHFKEELRGILTKEQLMKLRELLPSMKAGQGRGKGGPKGGGRDGGRRRPPTDEKAPVPFEDPAAKKEPMEVSF
ncbi:MAG: Spy/CpxP family protein refolding chaperone [Planctomycetes bacterium]|nr:Spy/CpxP family protein refolding chaperone [Planctomycetota bacterium]